MSIVDDILILIDSKDHILWEDIISSIGKDRKQIIASAIGRLTAKGLIIRKDLLQGFSYSISKAGKDRINYILTSIRKYTERSTNRSWQIVVFDIAEKQRNARDALRNNLINLGFSKLQDSIWISSINYHKEVEEIIALLKIKDNVTNLLISGLDSVQEMELVKKTSWNWREVNDQYQTFLHEAKKFLSAKNKESFKAKQLVFNFAKILQKDPKLPELLQPKNALTHQAFLLYQKIRPFCYKNH